jgi:hypothetical protein
MQQNTLLHEKFVSHELLMHQVSSDTIFSIIQSSAWQTLDQSITSAETNQDSNKEPDMASVYAGENTCGVEAFADLTFNANVNRILDVGGGKYNFAHDYMQAKGFDLLVWDPYNRSNKHNANIKKIVINKPVNAATSMAVLNVIPELSVRLAHIATLKTALSIGGTAYFKIWPGKDLLKGSYQPTINSYHCPGYQANAYIDRFLSEIKLVFGINNACLHQEIPNTIIAVKTSALPTKKSEIELIQKASINDAWLLKREAWLLKNKEIVTTLSALNSEHI